MPTNRRRFSITKNESIAVKVGLALLRAQINKIEEETGDLDPYWKWIYDIGGDLHKRLSAYIWIK